MSSNPAEHHVPRPVSFSIRRRSTYNPLLIWIFEMICALTNLPYSILLAADLWPITANITNPITRYTRSGGPAIPLWLDCFRDDFTTLSVERHIQGHTHREDVDYSPYAAEPEKDWPQGSTVPVQSRLIIANAPSSTGIWPPNAGMFMRKRPTDIVSIETGGLTASSICDEYSTSVSLFENWSLWTTPKTDGCDR